MQVLSKCNELLCTHRELNKVSHFSLLDNRSQTAQIHRFQYNTMCEEFYQHAM